MRRGLLPGFVLVTVPNPFEFPEMKPASPIYDKDTFCYATKEHTEFENANVVMTYACNSAVIAKVMNNIELYRPQVVVLNVPK